MGFPTVVTIAVFVSLALFLSLGVAAAPDQNRGQEVCSGRFEVFTQCGSACPKTCNGRNNDRNCGQVCVPGCVCQRGYIRNQRWQCVNPNQCRRQGSGGSGHNGGSGGGGGGRPFYDDFVPDGARVADATPAAPATPHVDVKN
ncbi:hypothetical protein RP20_CCG023448 [Aedes albopictus]|nr:hypothetical protein RP20_CCG023448 [Aedes albopictus]